MAGIYARLFGAGVRWHYLEEPIQPKPVNRCRGKREWAPFGRRKKTRTGPSVPVRVLSSKKSHEGGGEHSADELDKAIAVPTRLERNRGFGAANRASDSPSGR